VQTAPCYVPSFWHNTGVWRTDGQTDGRAVASTAIAKRRAGKIETKGSFGDGFPSIYNHVMAAFKMLFKQLSSPHRSTCCVQISWNSVHGKSVKSCVAYLTKKKQNFAWLSSYRFCARLKSARARSRQCAQSAPDFIQIGSLSVELYPIYPNTWTPSKRVVKWIQYSAETWLRAE